MLTKQGRHLDTTGNEVSGEDYFSTDPVGNGDTTGPVGDIDSEATAPEPVAEESPVEDEYPSEDVEDAQESLEPAAEADEDDEAGIDDWLPGFEGRFRVGEEDKALASYSHLEKEYSRKDQEFRELLAAEREAAFEQAKKLLAVEKQEPSWQEREQQRGQLIGLAMQDPTTAFQYALDSGDEASIDAVIKTVAQGDPELGIEGNPGQAMEMQRLVHAAQTQAAVAAQNARFEEMQARLHADEAKTRFEREYGEALTIPELAQELHTVAEAARDAGQFDTSSPEAIYGFMEDCLTKAYGRLAMKGALPGTQTPQATQPSQQTTDPRAAKRAARLESGRPTRATRQQEPTPAEDYASDLLGIAKEVNSGWRV